MPDEEALVRAEAEPLVERDRALRRAEHDADVTVVVDVGALTALLRELMPDETEVRGLRGAPDIYGTSAKHLIIAF